MSIVKADVYSLILVPCQNFVAVLWLILYYYFVLKLCMTKDGCGCFIGLLAVALPQLIWMTELDLSIVIVVLVWILDSFQGNY